MKAGGDEGVLEGNWGHSSMGILHLPRPLGPSIQQLQLIQWVSLESDAGVIEWGGRAVLAGGKVDVCVGSLDGWW